MPSFLGIDRFYMDGPFLGFLKAFMFLSVMCLGLVKWGLEKVMGEGAERFAWITGKFIWIAAVLAIIHGLWAFIDIVLVLHNGLDNKHSIERFGFHGHFGHRHVETAYYLSFIGVTALLGVICVPMLTLVFAVIGQFTKKSEKEE